MARTLLFIDTNILLDFYRAPQSDLSLEVFDKLLEHSSTLIISEQVEIEFNNNRKRVIDEYIKHIPTKIDNIALAPVLFIFSDPGTGVPEPSPSALVPEIA